MIDKHKMQARLNILAVISNENKSSPDIYFSKTIDDLANIKSSWKKDVKIIV